MRRPIGHSRARPAVAVAAPPAAPLQHYAESSFARQTIPVYVLRPTSCDTQPAAALLSLPPAGPVTPTQRLLDEIAGPAERTGAAPGASDLSQGGIAPGGTDLFPPGGPPLIVGPGTPGTPGLPGFPGPPGVPSLPPDTPPDTPPPIVTPPEGGHPPIVILPPGGGQPPTTPPVTVSAIPEPGTWSLTILGALAVGGALRSRRITRPRRKASETIQKP